MNSVKDQLDGDFQLEGQIPASKHHRPFFFLGGEKMFLLLMIQYNHLILMV